MFECIKAFYENLRDPVTGGLAILNASRGGGADGVGVTSVGVQPYGQFNALSKLLLGGGNASFGFQIE